MILIAGGDDTVGAASGAAPELLHELPHDHALHEYLYYPQAGHIVLDIPYTPAYSATLDGGTVAADSAAWASDWPATIKLIASH